MNVFPHFIWPEKSDVDISSSKTDQNNCGRIYAKLRISLIKFLRRNFYTLFIDTTVVAPPVVINE